MVSLRPGSTLRPLVPLALALVLAGCSDTANPPTTGPLPDPMPHPGSPVMTLRAFEWCWDHRDFGRYKELFSDDFVGACAGSDSAGNAFRGRAITRSDEFRSILHLFVGGGTYPPAEVISLELDRYLLPEPDARPGREDTTYHQTIATWFVLRIATRREAYMITGTARFWFVRGDVAAIPAELEARGFQPDSARWYIERWDDETLESAVAAARGREAPQPRAQPAKKTTWCAIKALYQ